MKTQPKLYLRPSRLQVYDACPAAYWLEQSVPERPPTPEMERGRAMHAAFEAAFMRPGAIAVPELTPNEAETVEDAVTRLKEFLAEHKYDQLSPPECEVTMEYETETWRMRGKLDLLFHGKLAGEETLVGVEFKSGFSAVPLVRENIQINAYILLALATKGLPVYFALLQRGDSCYTYAEPKIIPDLRQAIDELARRILEAKQSVPDRETPYCKVCNAYEVCPLINSNTNTALAVLDQGRLPAGSPRDWTPAQRQWFCDMLPKLKAAMKQIDALENAIIELMREDPMAVPGYTLKPGAIRYEGYDMAKFIEKICGLGIERDRLWSCARLDSTELKRLLVSLYPDKRVKDIENLITQLKLECGAERVQTKPTLVKLPES